MADKFVYSTPDGLDDILLEFDGNLLCGLRFIPETVENNGGSVLGEKAECETVKWLDEYFKGRDPGFVPKTEFRGISDFTLDVLNEIKGIPFGETRTYGEIAKRIADKKGMAKMSAQAVGAALGRNPIGIIIPCHRIIGAGNAVTGYAGGIRNKRKLLELEGTSI